MSATATIDIGTMIVQTPGVCGGRPRIAGHRITVRHIVIDHLHGDNAEEILVHYPTLNIAEIHAALAYYYANREAMDAMFRRQEDVENAFYEEHMRERKKKR